MRAVIQQVSSASVSIEGQVKSSIDKGLLILIGIEEDDNDNDINWLSGKISRLRIFKDDQGLMNLSIQDVRGEVLVISQFTLHASTKKGNRPSYIKAARPEVAIPLYQKFIAQLSEDTGNDVKTGEFGAFMEVALVNNGPVTIYIDTKNKE
ncbi:MAG: D-tyrosyl-tRNA(Tyr) deacylase [Bacteroidales bacterium]|nr:D-tyrosyl-tRNA(Tyr) deacylase [Bacteroidales bacterium]